MPINDVRSSLVLDKASVERLVSAPMGGKGEIKDADTAAVWVFSVSDNVVTFKKPSSSVTLKVEQTELFCS